VAPAGNPLNVGGAGRFGVSVKLKVTPLAVLGPLLVYRTVPETGWPALTLAGNVALAGEVGQRAPVIVAVAVLLAGFGSSVEELTVAVTVDVPEGGCV
jgi:hypothetical protein